MLLDIAMPRLSDQMEEATVIKWLKQPGDEVRRGEPLVEVETDKATMVYEAEFDGVLDEIVVEEGSTAALGATIARANGTGASRAVQGAASPCSRAGGRRRNGHCPGTVPAANGGKAGRSRATPVARRLAAELGVELAGVEGTGPGGRIVRADVRDARRPRPRRGRRPGATRSS